MEPFDTDDPLELLDELAEFLECARNQRIYDAGDPTGFWYRVVSGMAKIYVVRPDGRSQIIQFMERGDWFGQSLEWKHSFAVAAVAPGTVVARYVRAQIFARLRAEQPVRLRLLDLVFESLGRLQNRIVLLGRLTAQQRVAAFLLELSPVPGRLDQLVLPMSRSEIADYLVLSLETVSRTLHFFRLSGWIFFSSPRRIQIVDRAALRQAMQNLD